MLRFLSLAGLTQAALIAQQLVLLPLQIHTWGHGDVAVWLGAIALLNFVTAADLGLRNLGFAALSGGAPRERLATIWTLTRLHIALMTPAAAIAAFALFGDRVDVGDPLLAMLIVSGGLEAIFYIRVAFLEARGLIARSEALFLGLLVVRIGAGIAALALFEADPATLALIWMVTAGAAVIAQSVALGEVAPVVGQWRLQEAAESYRAAGWAASEPIAPWMQVQAPVIALSTFAAPQLVSAFVATRALFGLFRGVLQQIARIGSVRYVERLRATGQAEARGYLLLLAAISGWLGAGVALAVSAEHFWITGPLFDLPADTLVRIMILGFAVSAILSVHQIFVLSLMREGVIVASGAANYAYIAALVVACVWSVLAQSLAVLICGLVLSDLLMLALSGRPFWVDRTAELAKAKRLFLVGVGLWIAVATAGWTLLMFNAPPNTSIWEVARDSALALLSWLAAGALYWALGGKAMPRGFPSRPSAAPP